MLKKQKNLYMSYINENVNDFTFINLSTIRDIIKFTIEKYNITYSTELEEVLIQDFIIRYVTSEKDGVFKLCDNKCFLLACFESDKEYYIEDERDKDSYSKLFLQQLRVFYSEDIKTKSILEVYVILKSKYNKTRNTVRVTLNDDLKIISFPRKLTEEDLVIVANDVEKHYNIPIDTKSISLECSTINEVTIYFDSRHFTFYKYTLHLPNVDYPLFYIKSGDEVIRMNISLNDIKHTNSTEYINVGNLKFYLDYDVPTFNITIDKHIFKIELKKEFITSILEIMNNIL